MKKTFSLLVMPSFDSARESLGYEEFDDFNLDDVLFQQGYDGGILEVFDGETFEIAEGFVARINSEGEFYSGYPDPEEWEDKEDYRIEDDLPEGKYKYIANDNVILPIKAV